MKTPLNYFTLLALAAALTVAAENRTQAQDQPAPDSANAPATSDNALPPGIDPASPTAQVIKLTQAGSDVSVINAYVANSSSSFNLDADAILSLKDAGVPTDVINGMMNHDKNLTGSATVSTPAPAPAPTYSPAPDTSMPDTTTAPPADGQPGVSPDDSPDTAPPAAPVTVEYFDNTLSPYGSWVNVDGYGRCWRPTTVIYDSNWSPYCDRGHWVYTDCGWYWNSDYAWGATFHYGRWFRDGRIGWCWMPDTEWAPSWVTWRSANDYCGWAPLPPFTVYTPGIGFFFRGARVGVDFDFGLGADAFVFLSPGHLCDRRPRAFCVDRPHVGEVFRRTTIENHFDVHNRFVMNTGISVDRISAASHRHIDPVRVAALPTARREGWRGPVIVHQTDHGNFPNNNNNRFNNQFHGTPNTPDNHGQHFDNHPINQNVNGNHNVDVHQNNNQHSSITPSRPNPTISEFHNQAFIAPKAPAPPVNNSGNQHQNNAVNDYRINSGTVHNVPTPHTSAPENFSTPPSGQRFQQNQPHDYSGGQAETHNYYNANNNNNRSESSVAPSVSQAPHQSSGGGNGGGGNNNSGGGGGGQSHSSGSNSGSSSGSGSNSGQGRQGH